MAALRASVTRLAVRATLRPQCREIHMDARPAAHHPHRDISEIFTEVFSRAGGPHPSMERINRFMNTVYVHQPRAVTLFNINYRTQTERSTIKGLRVGTNSRRAGPQKNLILVSGLPMQDPSAIGVNLYVAAMLSRIQPMFPCDVSFIPLAHPREYEQRWRKAMSSRDTLSRDEGVPSLAPAPVPSAAAREDCIVPENISLELRDTCRPIEAYVTRQNKYYVNIEVDVNTHRSTMQYKNNSLANLASRGKHRRFFTDSSSLSPFDVDATPSSLSDPIRIHGSDSLLSPMLQSPSLVLELRSSQALDDDQIVARGEEVIAMMKELIE